MAINLLTSLEKNTVKHLKLSKTQTVKTELVFHLMLMCAIYPYSTECMT